jgi:hypothetical protein
MKFYKVCKKNGLVTAIAGVLSTGNVAMPVMSDCHDFRRCPIEGTENEQGTRVAVITPRAVP